MRSKLLIPGLAVAVLGITACGSSSSTSSNGSNGSSASTAAGTAPAKGKHAGRVVAIPSRTYSVKMTGKAETPPGAPSGSGTAVVAVHGKSDHLCWRFAHLKGFAHPTLAHIHIGSAGVSGAIVIPLSGAAKFKVKGCVRTSATLLTAIEKNPHGYYVNIHNQKYPGGVVRSQL